MLAVWEVCMNWLNAFELMCYLIVALMLADLIRQKDYDSLFTFGSAALVGFIMELLAVAVTDIYYYNNAFWLSLGRVPKQFPVFGGFMWGGLTVYGIKLAKKLRFGKKLTALTAGMLIVTMDLLLDVVAIRLDGGFWTWVGNPINLEITQHTFMSVIWVNFLGYMIETPTVVLMTLRKREKVETTDWKSQTIWMFKIAFGAIGVTAVGSLLALLLNMVTDDWFACIVFLIIWFVMAVQIIRQVIAIRPGIAKVSSWNVPIIIFWAAMYGYCLSGIVALEIHKTHLWFLAAGILFAAVTLGLCVAEE